jgi:hypothetical protein
MNPRRPAPDDRDAESASCGNMRANRLPASMVADQEKLFKPACHACHRKASHEDCWQSGNAALHR